MTRFTFVILLLGFLFVGCGTSGERAGSDVDAIKGSPKAVNPDDGVSISELVSKKSAKPRVYQVKATRPLEVPPELIPTTNHVVLENIAADAENELNVLPQVTGARIIKKDEDRWLEIDASAEEAWLVITEYWSLGNVNLVDFNPSAGIMETQWIEQAIETRNNQSGVASIARNLFTSFTKSNTSLDKYKLRFERLSKEKTALYVSHREIARRSIDYSKKVSNFEWVELPSDPEREAGLLQNLVLLFGQPGS